MAFEDTAHIFMCLTQEGKSVKEIACEDFDNNLELVSVWTDYMFATNWMYDNKKNAELEHKNKWVQHTMEKCLEKVMNPIYMMKCGLLFESYRS